MNCDIVMANVGGHKSMSIDLNRLGWSSEWV